MANRIAVASFYLATKYAGSPVRAELSWAAINMPAAIAHIAAINALGRKAGTGKAVTRTLLGYLRLPPEHYVHNGLIWYPVLSHKRLHSRLEFLFELGEDIHG